MEPKQTALMALVIALAAVVVTNVLSCGVAALDCQAIKPPTECVAYRFPSCRAAYVFPGYALGNWLYRPIAAADKDHPEKP